MDNDMNTPQAVAVAFDLARIVNKASTARLPPRAVAAPRTLRMLGFTLWRARIVPEARVHDLLSRFERSCARRSNGNSRTAFGTTPGIGIG